MSQAVTLINYLVVVFFFMEFVVTVFTDDDPISLGLYIGSHIVKNGLIRATGLEVIDDYLNLRVLRVHRFMIVRIWAYLLLAALALVYFSRCGQVRCLAKTIIGVSAALLALLNANQLFKFDASADEWAKHLELVPPYLIAGGIAMGL